MTRYAALLRGIGPGNPVTRNQNIRRICEELGFTNVESLLASGNLVFDAEGGKDEVEAQLEAAWIENIDMDITTVIVSKADLEKLVRQDPFEGKVHGPASYLLVTFYKKSVKIPFVLPFNPEGKTYTVIGVGERTLFTITDNTKVKTTDLMTWLEKQFGKEITSRSWNTLLKIYTKL